MPVKFAVFILIYALVLSACTAKTSAIPTAVQTNRAVPALGPLPASFAGDFPCADCAGIRYRLNLFPDRAFFLSMTYIGHDRSASFHDIGSWALSSDRRILVLKGGREAPLMLSIVGTNSLRKLDMEGREIESTLNYTLQRTEKFERLEPRLALHGMYRYLADAGLFTECLTGRRWPVAQEGDNPALEHGYLEVRRQTGDSVLVNLEGRVEMRPGMEDNTPRPTLVVDRFIGAWPGKTCAPRFATQPLENTPWKLTRLGDRAVFFQKNRPAPNLFFDPDTHRVSGSSDCNRLLGRYELDENRIRFDRLAGTRMACPEGMDTEKAFLEMLTRTRTWNVIGRHLEFYDAESNFLARFEAQDRP
jgi:copper homeostasis protein (lipoprotein)